MSLLVAVLQPSAQTRGGRSTAARVGGWPGSKVPLLKEASISRDNPTVAASRLPERDAPAAGVSLLQGLTEKVRLEQRPERGEGGLLDTRSRAGQAKALLQLFRSQGGCRSTASPGGGVQITRAREAGCRACAFLLMEEGRGKRWQGPEQRSPMVAGGAENSGH